MQANLYNYKATVTRIIDGDTIECTVELGFFITYSATVRLLGINAPEKNTDDGKKALDWLKQNLIEGHEVKLSVYKAPEKYGRWLAIVTYNGVDINQELVKTGHAVEYWGGKR